MCVYLLLLMLLPPFCFPSLTPHNNRQAAWDSKDVQLSTAMRQLDADIADSLELFDYAPKTTPGALLRGFEEG